MLSFPTVLTLMVAATILAIASNRVQVPYSVALVVGGMILTISGVLPTTQLLDPNLVFYVFLPALLFEAGLNVDLHSIRSNSATIATMALLGTLIAMAVTGVGLDLALPLPTIACFTLAAMLGGTDTVSILFAFRRAPVPRRLRELMSGETVFNDGVTLVAYATVVGLVSQPEVPSPVRVLSGMILATVGGAVIGPAIGLLGGLVLRQAKHDAMASIMATTAIAFVAYGVATALGVSGAVAAVVAGITVGGVLRRQATPQSRVAIQSFWDYVVFGVNTFLFLGIGLSTSLASIRSHLVEIALAVTLMFVGRAVAIYAPFALLSATRPAMSVPLRWQHVFVAGNIKGALAVAMALGLPPDMPARATLIDVALGVTFVSLVGQGLMLAGFVRWLGLSRVDPVAEAISLEQAKLVAAHGGRQQLEALRASGQIARTTYDLLRSEYQVAIARSERGLRNLHARHMTQSAQALLDARRRLLDGERAAVDEARMTGLLDETASATVLAELDARRLDLDRVLAEATGTEDA